MDTQLNTKRILIFLAFAFGIPWAATLAAYLTGMVESNAAQTVTLVNYVFITTPALANVATRLVTREGWGHTWLRPNFRRGWKYYLAAWLLPFAAMIAGCLVFYLLFPQSFDSNLTKGREIMASLPIAVPANPWSAMLVLILELMVLQGLVSGIVTIGEEFGWRAYLLQRLIDRFHGGDNASAGESAPSTGLPSSTGRFTAANARKAALLVGLIWGVWHWPMLGMSLTDVPYPGEPFLFPVIYLVSSCSLSILLSWAALRSGSVWPACIGHGTIIATMVLANSVMKGPVNVVLGPGANGLIGGLGYLGLALVLYFNSRAFAGKNS